MIVTLVYMILECCRVSRCLNIDYIIMIVVSLSSRDEIVVSLRLMSINSFTSLGQMLIVLHGYLDMEYLILNCIERFVLKLSIDIMVMTSRFYANVFAIFGSCKM